MEQSFFLSQSYILLMLLLELQVSLLTIFYLTSGLIKRNSIHSCISIYFEIWALLYNIKDSRSIMFVRYTNILRNLNNYNVSVYYYYYEQNVTST